MLISARASYCTYSGSCSSAINAFCTLSYTEGGNLVRTKSSFPTPVRCCTSRHVIAVLVISAVTNSTLRRSFRCSFDRSTLSAT